MSERKRITYTFKTLEAYQKHNDAVIKIIQDDTGKEFWICSHALPPVCYAPPVTPEAIKKIKQVDGDVVVNELE